MLMKFASLFLLVGSALAELAITEPIDSTICTGGQRCTVNWRNVVTANNVTLAQHGNCTIALYTGGVNQQTFLQPIAYPQAVNVSNINTIDFTVDPTIGPNDKNYFIRISSTTLHNPPNATAGNPFLSFSAKFELRGMTGKFNSTVQAQISPSSSVSAPTVTQVGTHTTQSAPSTTAGAASKNVVALGGLAAGGLISLILF